MKQLGHSFFKLGCVQIIVAYQGLFETVGSLYVKNVAAWSTRASMPCAVTYTVLHNRSSITPRGASSISSLLLTEVTPAYQKSKGAILVHTPLPESAVLRPLSDGR